MVEVGQCVNSLNMRIIIIISIWGCGSPRVRHSHAMVQYPFQNLVTVKESTKYVWLCV